MKKIISLVLLTMIILSSLAFVYAEVIQPRAWICDCGGYVTLRSTETRDWIATGSRGECPHGNIDHNPVIEERTIIMTYKCDSCSVAEEIIKTEERVNCR